MKYGLRKREPYSTTIVVDQAKLLAKLVIFIYTRVMTAKI